MWMNDLSALDSFFILIDYHLRSFTLSSYIPHAWADSHVKRKGVFDVHISS